MWLPLLMLEKCFMRFIYLFSAAIYNILESKIVLFHSA
jgi:hypothetical protein